MYLWNWLGIILLHKVFGWFVDIHKSFIIVLWKYLEYWNWTWIVLIYANFIYNCCIPFIHYITMFDWVFHRFPIFILCRNAVLWFLGIVLKIYVTVMNSRNYNCSIHNVFAWPYMHVLNEGKHNSSASFKFAKATSRRMSMTTLSIKNFNYLYRVLQVQVDYFVCMLLLLLLQSGFI